MKKWKKWSLGILAFLASAVIIFAALNWPTIKILMGTDELSGTQDTIPRALSGDQEPLKKGGTDWTSWHGPDGDRRSGVTGIITDWSAGLDKRWEVNYLCQGNSSAAWSSPVIQGNRLVICGRDTESDLVFCLDPSDGSLLWMGSYSATANASHGSGPRATPLIEDDRVYTFGRGGDLVCWNLLDGEQLWRKNVEDESGEAPQWGHASSPLIVDSRIIVQAGGTAGTIAYDKMTGSVSWKGVGNIAGYAAITRMDFTDGAAVLVFYGEGLYALDTVTGDKLWDIPWETSYDVNATTPVVTGDTIFITSGYKTGGTLLQATRSGVSILWQSKVIAAHHSDPYVIDGFLYGYSGDSTQNKGAFKCVRLSDGVEQWATNDMGWGTCSFVDSHLMCLDIKGNLFLMRPDPASFVKVTELQDALGDIRGPVWTKPVAANGRLYLRFKQKLICYDIIKGA